MKKLHVLLLFLFVIPQFVSAQSSGTGFFISNDGYIVTCYHVIEDANDIIIKGVNGDFNNKIKALVIATDKEFDLAILKANCTLKKNIPYSFNWNACEVGQEVFTLGYPLRTTMGEEIKLTNGIISSKSGYQGDISTYQISAPIQPGNSGGPLFDKKGFVVGIINAKHLGAENAGYAIKIKHLRNLIQSISEVINISQTNLLVGQPLIEQVKIAKNDVLIIEVQKNSNAINQNIKPLMVRTKSEAKVKDKPDVMGNILNYIPSNTSVEIVGKENSFWKIFYKGQIGFAHEMYFEDTRETIIIKEEAKFSKMPVEYQRNFEIATITSTAKMRNNYSVMSDIIKNISIGEIIYVVGFAEGFWKIYYDGSVGYLMDGMYFDTTYKMMRFK